MKKIILLLFCVFLTQFLYAQKNKTQNLPDIDYKDGIGLNFIRPDLNRPGHYSFTNDWEWILDQYNQLGVKWIRIPFSWVMIQPEKGRFDWTIYDKIVDKCNRNGINILATLGGHFDKPPVPLWAGNSLLEVVNNHPEYLQEFVRKWTIRYKGKIHYWEILNEPKIFHKGLTVLIYVNKILKPSYSIIKKSDSSSKVLPCAYNELPMLGSKLDFWSAARGYYDIQNIHLYPFWGYLLPDPSADPAVKTISEFRDLMVKNGEKDKPFWVTEIGWFGTAGITGGIYEYYKKVPPNDIVLKPYYTGEEIMKHPITIREDSLCSVWMKDLYPKALSINGCAKVFQWVVMDEFEDGYRPLQHYGTKVKGDTTNVKQVDIWGLIGGNKQWRKSAHTLKDIIGNSN